MQTLRTHLWLRYSLAIVITALLMIWIALNNAPDEHGIRPVMLFWITSVTVGWLQMILIARGVRASFGPDAWPGWSLMAVTALVGAVPLTFEIRWLLETLAAPPGGLPPPWISYLNVTVINLVFCLVQYVLIEGWSLALPDNEPDTHQSAPTSGEAPKPPDVRLLTRQPEGLIGEIQYLKIEDHYLRVTTPAGEGLVLHRLGDACRELAGTDGLQVHKSWWVSRAAIAEIRHVNRKRTILAKNGTKIPVGRSFEPGLRQAGWI